VGPATLLRNLLLASVAAGIAWAGPDAPVSTVIAWVGEAAAPPLIGLALAVILFALVGFEGWAILTLIAQNGRMLLRLEALEARLGGPAKQAQPAPGLLIGAPAPLFRLPSPESGAVELSSLLREDKPVMLVFSNANCGPCEELLPEVARWQKALENELTIALLSEGSEKDTRRVAARHALAHLAVQSGPELTGAYRVAGTPSAVMVRPDGRIGSRVAGGADAIRALVAQITHKSPPREPPGNGHQPAGRLGEPAPPLKLTELSGRRVELGLGTETLVLFWNPACGFCQKMLPELKAWEANPPEDAPKLVVVSSGPAEDNRAMGLASPVLLEETGWELSRAFGANGTPSAILVDKAGRIASEVAVGKEAVFVLAGGRHEVLAS
jgi:Thiol-disulfide isomerase and thioredoxins